VNARKNARSHRQHWLMRTLPPAACLAFAAGMVGCEVDSFFDPSVVGRWEFTATELPILERLDIIEDDQGDFDEAVDVTPADLEPVIEEYRFGPGDVVRVETWDLFGSGQLYPFERLVDGRGMIDLGVIGEVRAQGLSAIELKRAVAEAISMQGLVVNPTVSVVPLQQRQVSFSLYGAALRGSGTYFISKPDYRMLQALTDAGGIAQSVQEVYVIRQVPLTPETSEGVTPGGQPYRDPGTGMTPTDEPEPLDLEQYLEQTLSEDQPEGSAPAMLPGDVHRRSNRVPRQPSIPPEAPVTTATPTTTTTTVEPVTPAAETTTEPEPAPIDLPEGEPATEPSTVRDAPVVIPSPTGETDGDSPIIDLPDDAGSAAAEAEEAPTPYIFVNGEWVLAQPRREGEDGESGIGADDAVTYMDPITGRVMSQTIIRVPVDELLAGEARYNLVIRPGDVIRVPTPPQGNIYLGGEVLRPGTYNLPFSGKLTVKQAVIAAGGLNALAIPERVDLIRRISSDREAVVRLNLRAIFEGTEPDLFLKPEDIINVGTNWTAAPIAVMRNGFRASYGFGFLLDRNFGNDIFGPPPVRRTSF
jgi:protein involved in polysaccharide export with SLBB domain